MTTTYGFEIMPVHLMQSLSKRRATIIALLLMVGASFFAGFNFGKDNDSYETLSSVENKNPEVRQSIDFSPFWKAWNTLDEKFVSSSTTTDPESKNNSEERIWGAISGMVDSLGDPYTSFFPPVESKIFESDISGNFQGVGIEIGMRDGILTVVAPLKGTPAFRAGIKSGDKILRINETSTEKIGIEEAVKMIRGEGGTKVTFTIFREGVEDPIVIPVTRGTIDIPTIESNLRSDGIYVIKLFNFSAVSPSLFRDSLRQFVRTGSNKLILDLRGNPGGYLEASIDMASWFLPSGTVVVQEDFKKDSELVTHRSKGYDIFSKNLKMVILIDGGSASASEILAGALQENGVAQLVGTQSFGKGSVQELVKITPDTSLKVTIARWLTPKGHSISAGGLTPDHEVKFEEKDIKNGTDPQMNKAVELLLKK